MKIDEIDFCQSVQKTQAILCVLTSIFGLIGANIAVKIHAGDLFGCYS